MGYTTDFSGQLKITPALKPEHEAYLRAFANTRRMARSELQTKNMPDPLREAVGLPVGVEGGYYVGSPSNHGQDATPDVVDHNEPPAGQPGLWCQWTIGEHPPETAGDVLEWDGGEKFYEYVEWLEYLVQHFFQPWGYLLTGQIKWQGEDSEDVGCIDVRRNVVRSYQGSVVYPGLEPDRAACGCVGSEPDKPCPKCAIDEATITPLVIGRGTIRALEDISNGYAPTPATGTADMAKIAAAVLGFLEADGNLGMTYDENPEDPRSVAYDLGRALGHALEEK